MYWGPFLESPETFGFSRPCEIHDLIFWVLLSYIALNISLTSDLLKQNHVFFVLISSVATEPISSLFLLKFSNVFHDTRIFENFLVVSSRVQWCISRARVFRALVHESRSLVCMSSKLGITHSRKKKWHTLHAKDVCKRSCWLNWFHQDFEITQYMLILTF